MRKIQNVLIVGLALSGMSFGQYAISAKSGLISYVEGRALLGEQEVVVKTGGRLTEMKPEQTLKTEEGRAEVLLSPGVILRLGENSSLKMIANRLEDTRVELLSGVANVEAAELPKDVSVTLLVGDAAVSLRKTALVMLDAEKGIRVYKGEAQVMAGGSVEILKDGREMALVAGQPITKFDKKETDSLYRWAARRAEYHGMANIASANSVHQSSQMSSFASGWIYNPYFNMYTYLPSNGMYNSPFGFVYYSPTRVSQYYNAVIRSQMPVMNSNSMSGGGFSGPRFDSDLGYHVNSRAAISSAPMGGGGGGGAAAAPAAAPARGADSGGVRGGGGGSSR